MRGRLEKGPLLIRLGIMFCVLIAYFRLSAATHVSSTDKAIHVEMSGILQGEIPHDVTTVEFDASGRVQECFLSDSTHRQNAAFDDTPHEVKLDGRFRRTAPPASGWESLGNLGFWVSARYANTTRTDGDAVSSEDFRQVVRRCVAAVRAESHRPRQWPLTSQQNRDSWNAASAQDKIATSTNNSNGIRE